MAVAARWRHAGPLFPLEMLGFAAGHNDLWADANRNISAWPERPDFAFVLEHYNSAGLPGAFWPELLKQNPDAKVVLTVREPASLHRSINGAWCRLIGGGSLVDRIAKITLMRPYGVRNYGMHEAMAQATARLVGMPGLTWWRACNDEAYAIEAFKAWNAKVRREARLQTARVRDGQARLQRARGFPWGARPRRAVPADQLIERVWFHHRPVSHHRRAYHCGAGRACVVRPATWRSAATSRARRGSCRACKGARGDGRDHDCRCTKTTDHDIPPPAQDWRTSFLSNSL